jgi:hypothetical protein
LVINSGVGKSSLAQAGVLTALKRQAWPESADTALDWPVAFQESRRWCFLTLKPGTEPIKALVESFFDTWQLGATDPERVKQQNGWIKLLRNGEARLRDLLDATERRYKELDRSKPPAFLLYVDQGEELYVRAEERQRRRFSEVISGGVGDPSLYMLMSMRSDFLGELQKDESLFKVHRKIDVPPLREAELRKVVSCPAELLSARFETAELVDIITRRTAEDSVKGVGALPLLSYTLDDMWTQMVKRGDGVLRLPAQSFELGRVLSDRADAFLADHPKSHDELRRIFTLKLATVREGEEPTRRPRCVPSFRMRNGGSCPSLRIIRIVFWSRRRRKAAKPMLRWRMRPSSGAGISSATGLRRSASSSPGEPGSKPPSARGSQRRTAQRNRHC